jgi:peptidoglycan/xylan/chitin deacetylase (PgdA/CDA1 family)
MKRRTKALLSRVDFALQRIPEVIESSSEDISQYLPEPYRAVLIISADFELAWAWRYAKDHRNPYETALRYATLARGNVPKILELCNKNDIPITWATVGHLFLKRCDKHQNLAHSRMTRLPYHENEHWRFDRGDWFDDDPCTDWLTSPEWYAPDLIKRILASKVNHEVACHTFSHIDCSNNVCPSSIFQEEIDACKASASEFGIELRSFVHPGHTIGNLATLKDSGFSSFRTDYRNVLGYPKRHANGLWEFGGTSEFAYRNEWSVNYHIYRYSEIIERALRNHKVCYYWFHPSVDPVFVDRILPSIFEFANSKRKILWVTNMKEYTNWLDDRHNEKI